MENGNEIWAAITARHTPTGWIYATYESATTGEWDDAWYPPGTASPDIVALADEDEEAMSGAGT
jgi:hypothetical protein